ncbi:hypothetical protein BDP27DRAFT_148848 [Rhodocollybia butyracea]|uniref:Uncharacterized protein n=1 Tax=Rhodocollybia butyracea TaxID=206335 RepID=A0A9P5PYB0_9AGAR|nr:hypothetical protein BDP27DRAFT_148848 [Rhodocollybia butyracea]
MLTALARIACADTGFWVTLVFAFADFFAVFLSEKSSATLVATFSVFLEAFLSDLPIVDKKTGEQKTRVRCLCYIREKIS